MLVDGRMNPQDCLSEILIEAKFLNRHSDDPGSPKDYILNVVIPQFAHLIIEWDPLEASEQSVAP